MNYDICCLELLTNYRLGGDTKHLLIKVPAAQRLVSQRKQHTGIEGSGETLQSATVAECLLCQGLGGHDSSKETVT